MKAIILAAGRGMRLMPYTTVNPKCLIDFDGETFLHHQIKTLLNVGIDKIIIVTGYGAGRIRRECEKYENIRFFHNFDYAKTGTLNSMSLAAEEFNDDLIVLNSDIIFEEDCLRMVKQCPDICVAIELDRYEEGATALKVDYNGNVLDMGFLNEEQSSGLSVGIVKFPKETMEEVKNFLKDYPPSLHCYVFNLVKHFIGRKPVKYAACPYGSWCEIDTLDDLKLYKDIIPNLLQKK